MKSVFLLPAMLLYSCALTAQVEVRLTVEGATVETDCDDFLSEPDPLWAVAVEGQTPLVYPQQGGCFNALPNTQYTATYDCPDDAPATVEVCFSAFENDPLIPFGCFVNAACLEERCEVFPLPDLETALDTFITLPATGASRGTLNFTLEFADLGNFNDLPCQAVSFGTISRGDTIGSLAVGPYDNICASNENEPDPATEGFFDNQRGVWFEFMTGDNPGTSIRIEGVSDPEGIGDDIDLQLAIYQADTCTGNFQFINAANPFFTNEVFTRLNCPQPNTRYFIMVDGTSVGPDALTGVFGLRLINLPVDDASDTPCGAASLGQVPLGGTVGLDTMLANFCATGQGDPFNPVFGTQASVWATFEAPLTGHVRIEAISDRDLDSIGIQMALFRSVADCSGPFLYEAASYDGSSPDETIQISCLEPGETYYVAIDGEVGNLRGIFDLQVTDAGDITPVTELDTTICAGTSLLVGSSAYTAPGNYADTISIGGGCDSIVNTTLNVLEPLVWSLEQTQPAIGEGNPNGIANASLSGGAGAYTIEWCNGVVGDSNSTLTGGAECCLIGMDTLGCTTDTCFTVEFVTDIIPSFTASPADCNAEASGRIEFTAMNGQPPYQYEWQNADNTVNGNGIINAENELVALNDLLAGPYEIRIFDAFFDTTFTVEVTEPAPLAISLENRENASCFAFCDGSLEVSATGGTPPYTREWNTGSDSSTISGLCAGTYTLTLTDDNGCTATEGFNINEPPEFIASINVSQPVSCFGGSDGTLSASANQSPVDFAWSNGGSGTMLSGLPAGDYELTVTNADGCLDTASVFLPAPLEPVEASIVLREPVRCHGEANGILEAVAEGPGEPFAYQWSDGASSPLAQGLTSGEYSLTITNERGCQDTAVYNLAEPSPLSLQVSATDLTCLSGDKGGAVRVDTAFGGTPPYEYSLDGVVFKPGNRFSSLFAGTYTVIAQDSRGCEAEVEAEVAPAPVVDVEALATDSLQLGDSLLLQAQVSGGTSLQYTWTVQDGSGRTFSGPSVMVSPLISTSYQLMVLDTVSQCRDSDVVFVKVSKDRRVYIPNAFSPNGDGVNDWFFIQSDDAVIAIRSLRIFSRTGSLMFEAENIAPNAEMQGWNGLFRGEELNPGQYVYVAEIEFIDGRTEVFKGGVMLMR